MKYKQTILIICLFSILLLNCNFVKSDSSIEYNCLNGCSGNGVCNFETAICMCNDGWSGPDCSILNYTQTPSPIKCYGNPVCGGPNNGYCDPPRGCICFSPFTGLGCLSQVIIIPNPQINTTNPNVELNNGTIICENTANGLTIKSYTNINCTGYGVTECIDNNSESSCSTNQSDSIIKCTVKSSNYRNSSITCKGNHIVCSSSYVQCNINIQGDFLVNNIISNSNIAIFKDGQQTNIDNNLNSQSKSSTSSVFQLIISNINLYISLCLLFLLSF